MRIKVLVLIMGFAGGIAFRSFFDWGDSLVAALIMVASILACVGFYAREKKVLGVVVLLLFSSAFGMLRLEQAEARFVLPELETTVGRAVLLQGIVVEDPDRRDTHTKLTIRPKTINEIPVSGKTKALILVPAFETYHYGDEIIAKGILNKPKNFATGDKEGGRPFDYVAYLKKDGIGYQMVYPAIEKTGENKGNPLITPLIRYKRALLSAIERAVPEPSAGMLGGILFGEKHLLSEDLLESLRVTGIVHIVVLSGYNVSLIARSFGVIVASASGPLFFALSTMGVLAFGAMVGWGATVARAVFMALIILFARVTGRSATALAALFIAAWFMLLWNPFILLNDVSFQLSFLATVGIVTGTPFLERTRMFSLLPPFLREVASATLATQAWVLPLLIYQMGTVSLVALFVNLLVLPLMPLVMLSGFLAGFTGLFAAPLGAMFGIVAHVLLSYALFIVSLFSVFPFASITIGAIPTLIPLSLYAVAFAFLIKRRIVSQSHSN